MDSSTPKDTPDILTLITQAQNGNSRAEDKLVRIYEPYINFMVRQYSKKTDIKDDDDLRSCICIGLLEGIRRFDPTRNTRFIYFAHTWMKKNIFLEESIYRFIRIPVNQQQFYKDYTKQLAEKEVKQRGIDYIDLSEFDYEEQLNNKKFIDISKTRTDLFTDLVIEDEETHTSELPEHLLHNITADRALEAEEDSYLEGLKNNIKKVLMNFSIKEVFIIEHLFGLNGAQIMSSDQIAKELNVTKVNITFTKTRVIRMLRHTSLSNMLIDGI